MDFNRDLLIDDTGDHDIERYVPTTGGHSTHFTNDAAARHDHGISGGILPEGGNEPFDNRPAFYSLAFIIKVK